ncbi:MAG: hypothetical protein IT529_12240 [Burkholderiales bacterium]|nr:hypothetical protein [Burkholderiales bacterium]
MDRSRRFGEQVAATEAYYRQQGMLGPVLPRAIDHGEALALDLSAIVPNVAGPKRPRDRIPLAELAPRFREILAKPVAEGSYAKATGKRRMVEGEREGAQDGAIVIAAITSCPDTSNPGVMLAAGLREFRDARALALLGVSVTIDQMSPIGDIRPDSPAGRHLHALGVAPADFNNIGQDCAQ